MGKPVGVRSLMWVARDYWVPWWSVMRDRMDAVGPAGLGSDVDMP